MISGLNLAVLFSDKICLSLQEAIDLSKPLMCRYSELKETCWSLTFTTHLVYSHRGSWLVFLCLVCVHRFCPFPHESYIRSHFTSPQTVPSFVTLYLHKPVDSLLNLLQTEWGHKDGIYFPIIWVRETYNTFTNKNYLNF